MSEDLEIVNLMVLGWRLILLLQTFAFLKSGLILRLSWQMKLSLESTRPVRVKRFFGCVSDFPRELQCSLVTLVQV